MAAPGPSLTAEVVHRVRLKRWIDQWNVIAVNDAYRVMPWADVVYGCDGHWWDLHKYCEGFRGERWSSHGSDNDKSAHAEKFGINLVCGRDGDEFSCDPEFIRYGSNSGFQAVNLAILFGCTRIVLVGFDMRRVQGKAHFFGDHPAPLPNIEDHGYRGFARHFERAAKKLPAGVSIVNATPDSALTCFQMMSLDDAIRTISRPDSRVSGDRSELQQASG